MIAHPQMLQPIPTDAVRSLRKRENRARIAAVATRVLGLVQLSEFWREDAADAREARLDIERPLFGDGPCRVGSHVGRMLDTERMDAAGGVWATLATCSACHSTIDRREFAGVCVMDLLCGEYGSEVTT